MAPFALKLGKSLREFPPSARYLIGLSGGRDSVALLDALVRQGYRKLVVCHLNHQLRGRASEADARQAADQGEQQKTGVLRLGVDQRPAAEQRPGRQRAEGARDDDRKQRPRDGNRHRARERDADDAQERSREVEREEPAHDEKPKRSVPTKEEQEPAGDASDF